MTLDQMRMLVQIAESGSVLAAAENLFARFKDVADKKKSISDADLEALMADERYQPREVFRLEGLQVVIGDPDALIHGERRGRLEQKRRGSASRTCVRSVATRC